MHEELLHVAKHRRLKRAGKAPDVIRVSVGEQSRVDLERINACRRQRDLQPSAPAVDAAGATVDEYGAIPVRSEEHTSELQSLMRISYAGFCWKKKTYEYASSGTHSKHASCPTGKHTEENRK